MVKKFFLISLLIFCLPLMGKAASSLSANGSSTCFINNGQLFCAGNILGDYRNLKDQFHDTSNVNLVSVGGTKLCFLAQNTLFCYGQNSSQVYYQPTPFLQASNIRQLVSGSSHSCLLLAKQDNAVECWGVNNNGQLGNGTTTDSISPVIPLNLYNPKACETIIQINTHHNHTCAIIRKSPPCVIKAYNYLKCWGMNNYGQLGNGKTINDYLDLNPPSPLNILERFFRKIFPKKQKPPQENQPIIATVVLESLDQVSTGANHTCYHYCIPLVGCFVKCFGLNNYGQLGNGADLEQFLKQKHLAPYETQPVLAKNLELNVSFLASGDNHNCAIVNGGQVKCWGDNRYGQLGDGTKINRSTPVLVKGIANAVSLSLGSYHSCALLANGEIKCWGNNINGQLMDGTRINSSLPVSVALPLK